MEESLPHDLITHHILTKLPVKSLIRFKSVSKLWYSTLSSPNFPNLYFKLSPFFHPSSPIHSLFIQNGNNYYLLSYDHDDSDDTYVSSKNLIELGFDFGIPQDDNLDLIGSCNGLVCLASSFAKFFILCNPFTGKFRSYSDHDLIIDNSKPCRVSWGFGYVANVDDYKVIRILELPVTLEIRVHVFSLNSNNWTTITDQLYQSLWFPFSLHSRVGVLVNETLYWTVNFEGLKAVTFNLVSEKFDMVKDLNLGLDFVYCDKFLCVMGGCLSKCGVNMRDDVYIHMFKGLGKVETIYLFRNLHLHHCQSLIGFTRSGKFFILLGTSTLGLVDPSSLPMKYMRLVTFNSSRNTRITSYVPSLSVPYAIGDLSGNDLTCQGESS